MRVRAVGLCVWRAGSRRWSLAQLATMSFIGTPLSSYQLNSISSSYHRPLLLLITQRPSSYPTYQLPSRASSPTILASLLSNGALIN